MYSIGRLVWAANTSHAHIWDFHGNVHIAWGFYCIGMIILYLIPCSLQNIDESVPECLELKLCLIRSLRRYKCFSPVWFYLVTCAIHWNYIHALKR